ncbi:MAG TPA: hypothetical protein VLF66_06490 [Thermoanaerobaculia bacterium]|nr:hypothetical protein [Thermoanaerobaculia bacterium]
MRRYALLALAVLFTLAPAASAQEEPPPGDGEAPQPLLTLAGVKVEGPVAGEAPGPESLVRLTVEIANRGEEIASALVFTVTVAGQPLPVYEKQVFLKAIPPGGATELRLYNFWTGETGRPAPADGKLPVEVTLTEARWMDVSTDEEGVEVWKPLGDVEGLPASASTVVSLEK